MHYLDEGAGDPVLCLHGEPTWSFLYRKMIPGAGRGRPGGRAGLLRLRPLGQADGRGWYTFDRHCASIARLVEELDLRGLTLVVQDWGGPIGLRLAVEQPERVARLVILNTGVGGGRPPSETWLRFREVVRAAGGDFQPGRLIRTAAVRGLADDVVAAYDAPFPTPESKAGVLAFPELVPTEPEHPNTAPLMAIREALGSWEKPALVLFGDSDPIFRPEVAEAIARLIPGALPAELVENAGHFVQEDAGEEVAARIVEFLRRESPELRRRVRRVGARGAARRVPDRLHAGARAGRRGRASADGRGGRRGARVVLRAGGADRPARRRDGRGGGRGPRRRGRARARPARPRAVVRSRALADPRRGGRADRPAQAARAGERAHVRPRSGCARAVADRRQHRHERRRARTPSSTASSATG